MLSPLKNYLNVSILILSNLRKNIDSNLGLYKKKCFGLDCTINLRKLLNQGWTPQMSVIAEISLKVDPTKNISL